MSDTPRIGQVLPSTANTSDPITPTYIPELTADKISSGTISAATIVVGDDGIIKVGTGTTTVELVEDGLYGYVDNQQVFRLANGELFVKGTIQADRGYFAGDLVGNTLTGASINGSTITGGTITIGSGNAVFSASGLGISVGSGVFATAPFRVSADGSLTATNATISGTINGASITGSTITGSTINLGSGRFTVDAYGNMSASGANIVGTISTSGIVGAGRVSMSQFAAIGAEQDPSQAQTYGALQFFTSAANESPVQITARSDAQVGGHKVVRFDTGVDGASGVSGPSMVMSVANAPAGGYGGSWTVTSDLAFLTVTNSFNVRGGSHNVQYPVLNTAIITNWDAPFTALRYWLTVEGEVCFAGLTRAVTAWPAGQLLFTLPAGFRPINQEILTLTINGTVLGRVDVLANGQVTVQIANFAAGNYVNWNSARFWTR